MAPNAILNHMLRAVILYPVHLSEIDDNPWAPFNSQMDWLRRLWDCRTKNSRELNAIIDDQLPEGRPVFQRQEIVVGGEAFEVYFRPIIECVRALYGDPEFAQDLIFSPERHYADLDKTIRLYHDLHTAKWCLVPLLFPSLYRPIKPKRPCFRNKAAYPVYMTIGNIPKDIRRKPSRQGYILIGYLPTTRLDHIKVAAARRRALSNLYHACMRKILSPLKDAGLNGIKMASGDGVLRRCHPILAIFAGDYPEQCLVTGIKSGECPTCVDMFEPRDLDADLPFVNIFLSITPDILHQLYQGVIKHVVNWLKAAFGPAEIDARCRRLPPNHNVRLFLKGITTLSRISGTEHGQICRILLGLIVDLHLPERQSTARLIRCVRDLRSFHDNKSIFIDLGIRDNFKIPKLHNISHYPLHDEYLQMTLWLERKEKILRHEKFIRWRCAGSPPHPLRNPPGAPPILSNIAPTDDKLSDLTDNYRAEYFRDAFARFVVGFQNPDFSKRQVEAAAADYFLPFQSNFGTKIRWDEKMLGTLDVVHVKPGYTNKHGRRIGGRFDTVMANDGTGEHTGIKGYRVGRVRAVFSLSERVLNVVFTGPKPAKHLAYVEWFSKFPNAPDLNHKMYKISIIPVSNIRRSVHLFPQFGPVAPREWTSENVLDLCTKFYVSPWSDRHAMLLLLNLI
ncbi:hypothetical protein B0H14DRAFT_3093459 [Mycena olivaceomarginata]|nr:hypothetical protein B0H14DRAFT_3093459 [Mycena olivaceomarginata]